MTKNSRVALLIAILFICSFNLIKSLPPSGEGYCWGTATCNSHYYPNYSIYCFGYFMCGGSNDWGVICDNVVQLCNNGTWV